jgi:hypothetical protein
MNGSAEHITLFAEVQQVSYVLFRSTMFLIRMLRQSGYNKGASCRS